MIDYEVKIVLRQAQPADAWELAELRFAALAEMGQLAQPEAPGFIRRAAGEFFRLFAEERLAAWLLEADGRTAGCACAIFWERLPYPETSLHAEICGVYVIPELRRRGYATELVGEAMALARGRGARKIVLSSTEDAREIYRRLGFSDESQMALRASARR